MTEIIVAVISLIGSVAAPFVTKYLERVQETKPENKERNDMYFNIFRFGPVLILLYLMLTVGYRYTLTYYELLGAASILGSLGGYGFQKRKIVWAEAFYYFFSICTLVKMFNDIKIQDAKGPEESLGFFFLLVSGLVTINAVYIARRLNTVDTNKRS